MDMLLGDNSLGHKEIKALRRGYSIAAVLSFIVLAFFVFVIVTLWAHFAELYLQTLESIMDGEDGHSRSLPSAASQAKTRRRLQRW